MSRNKLYEIALTMIPGIGDVVARKLIAYCGGVEAVFRENKRNLMKIPGVGNVISNAIVNQRVLSAAEFEMTFMQQNNIRAISFLDDDYPYRLKQCADSPVVIFAQGNGNLNKDKVVGIVGTRKATDYGKIFTEQLISELKSYDVSIVSGLAYGIDICAHKYCLQEDVPTLAVLGHGLDRIYPPGHQKAAMGIIEKGALISEFPSGTTPEKENFPKRNRIIAGMIDVLVVVESAGRGGSIITAEIANSYHRDVFALPGRVNDSYSEGCNHLIRSNKANLITSAKDIEYIMGWDVEHNLSENTHQTELFLTLSKEEEEILGVLSSNSQMAIDVLSMSVKMPVSKLIQVLLQMELRGLVKALPGKLYKRI